MLTLPPTPFVAEPVRRVIIPELPLVVDPEVIDKLPDTPLEPALEVRTLKVPLDFAAP
jgi:hypothetical protein